MNEGATEQKAAIRAEIRRRLSALTPDRRRAASLRACAVVESASRWQKARRVLLYYPLPDEIDSLPLLRSALKSGKEVSLPRYREISADYSAARLTDLATDMVVGRFGTREPSPHCEELPLNQLDFVLVPGVAFTLFGLRLGRGKGFYDRLLPLASGFRVGMGFDEQVVDSLPCEPHDCRLDAVVTPTYWRENAGTRV